MVLFLAQRDFNLLIVHVKFDLIFGVVDMLIEIFVSEQLVILFCPSHDFLPDIFVLTQIRRLEEK